MVIIRLSSMVHCWVPSEKCDWVCNPALFESMWWSISWEFPFRSVWDFEKQVSENWSLGSKQREHIPPWNVEGFLYPFFGGPSSWNWPSSQSFSSSPVFPIPGCGSLYQRKGLECSYWKCLMRSASCRSGTCAKPFDSQREAGLQNQLRQCSIL